MSLEQAVGLSWGTCRTSSESDTKSSWRHQRGSESANSALLLAGPAVLIVPINVPQRKRCYLCRLPRGVQTLEVKDDATVLLFSPSVCVDSLDGSGQVDDKFSSTQPPVFQLHCSSESLQDYSEYDEGTICMARFCPPGNGPYERYFRQTSTLCFVNPLKNMINQTSPTSAVSVRLQHVFKHMDRRSVDSVDPALLQACLKRQLVGALFLFQEGKWNTTFSVSISTRVHSRKETWQLTIESVSSSAETAANVLFAITPSTRLTLVTSQTHKRTINSEEEKPKGNNETSTDLSLCAQILFDVMDMCLQQAKNTCSAQGAIGKTRGPLPPRSYVLTGPPGVGKTFSVRTAIECIRKKYSDDDCALLVSFSGSDLLGKSSHLGDASKELQTAFAKAAGMVKSPNKVNPNVTVLFLDEAEALVSSTLMGTTLAWLLDRMNTCSQWSHLIVVAATNHIGSIPEYMRRPGRFDREIAIAPPTSQERMKILSALLQNWLRSFSSATIDQPTEYIMSSRQLQQLSDFASVCVGYVPSDLAALVRRAIILYGSGQSSGAANTIASNSDQIHESWDLLMDCLQHARKDVGASALRDAVLKAPPSTTWDDIAGNPGSAKTALRQAIEWPRTHQEAFQALGLAPPRGILLYGPPGCAKTTLARAAAGASGVSFLSLSPAEVYASSYVGEAESVVRRAFALARSAAPCVLFFDEIDSIIGVESGLAGHSHGMVRGNSAEARVLSTFLNEMDGIDSAGSSRAGGVLVLAATNRPWTLDAALLRPGRFDKIIGVPAPDQDGRRAILELETHSWLSVDKESHQHWDLDALSSEEWTGKMTGAEIVGACREAARSALREALGRNDYNHLHVVGDVRVRPVHLRDALRQVQPLLADPRIAEEYNNFESKSRG